MLVGWLHTHYICRESNCQCRRLPLHFPTPSPSSHGSSTPAFGLRFLQSSAMTSLILLLLVGAAAAAGNGCPLAIASYYFSAESNLTFIASLFGITDYHAVLPYNPFITNPDYIITGYRCNVPFSCSCLRLPSAPASTFLAGSLPYALSRGVTYDSVAADFANLTTTTWLQATNSYPPNEIPKTGTVNVTVNCSCGDVAVSPRYGLFLTYPLWDGETLASVAANYGFSSPAEMELLRKYNPGMDEVSGKGIVFIPVKDPNGSYRPLESGNGLSGGATAGIVIASVVVLTLGIWSYVMFYRRQKAKKAMLLPSSEESVQLGSAASMDTVSSATPRADGASPAAAITVEKSIEFSYEELYSATKGFSMHYKIGQGGFGSVYYAELRGEKVAIKKMDIEATQEFLAELKVLTHVHHLNLVRLIGHCVESCLFLVYEFVENGNLSQHLRGTGYEPLSWATRVQIALDSARGLEYIHEHTVPVYVHRDIKSANILIDKDFRAKVADFGLTKLTTAGSMSLRTGVVGTFGYMPPEYARLGEVSPKVDIYAFGVVLYELISAKEAVVRSTESTSDPQGLVYLFVEVFNSVDPKEALQKVIDPMLGGDYPIDSVLKMAYLAKSCTDEVPKMRPTMRSVVVTLMTLLSKREF